MKKLLFFAAFTFSCVQSIPLRCVLLYFCPGSKSPELKKYYNLENIRDFDNSSPVSMVSVRIVVDSDSLTLSETESQISDFSTSDFNDGKSTDTVIYKRD